MFLNCIAADRTPTRRDIRTNSNSNSWQLTGDALKKQNELSQGKVKARGSQPKIKNLIDFSEFASDEPEPVKKVLHFVALLRVLVVWLFGYSQSIWIALLIA